MRRQGARAAGLLAACSRRFSALPCHDAEAGASRRNLAAVMHGINDLRFEEHALPSAVAPGSVRVAMKAVGICGSDLHYLQHVRCCAVHNLRGGARITAPLLDSAFTLLFRAHALHWHSFCWIPVLTVTRRCQRSLRHNLHATGPHSQLRRGGQDGHRP
jgi:hypothetical protein